MSDDAWIQLAAAVLLLGLIAYVLLGGADFGGGVWDLFATGPRKRQQRKAIAAAMGPVWEANHVWLIFVIVLLFTCFPGGYGPLAVALFLPFHLALIGIMLRGASFVFRGYRRPESTEGNSSIASQRSTSGMSSTADSHSAAKSGREAGAAWGTVFGVASVVSPFLLGAAFGAVTAGHVRVDPQGGVHQARAVVWLSPYAVGCGALALSACAYLAAVYLTVETEGELREDFRRRAILSGTSTAALAVLVLILAWHEAPWFVSQLLRLRSWPVLAAGVACFAASAWAVFGGRYRWSRIFAAGEIALLLLGWGIAHQPYLIYPDVTLADAAAPAATLAFVLTTLPFGVLVLVPSLWFLFKVFKSEMPSV